MNILTSKQVTYEYRNAVQTVRAVNGVSCTFQQGHVYAIVGPSGSGKTTFLSLLAGLDVPDLRHDRIRRRIHGENEP